MNSYYKKYLKYKNKYLALKGGNDNPIVSFIQKYNYKDYNYEYDLSKEYYINFENPDNGIYIEKSNYDTYIGKNDYLNKNFLQIHKNFRIYIRKELTEEQYNDILNKIANYQNMDFAAKLGFRMKLFWYIKNNTIKVTKNNGKKYELLGGSNCENKDLWINQETYNNLESEDKKYYFKSVLSSPEYLHISHTDTYNRYLCDLTKNTHSK